MSMLAKLRHLRQKFNGRKSRPIRLSHSNSAALAQAKDELIEEEELPGHVVHVSQDDFGPLRGSRLLPQLGDFDLAFPELAGQQGHLSAIQPHCYRAPEVLLGVPWSYSADIWNLGLLMWNLLENVSLFGRPAGEDGEYDAHVHLAQMITLLGPPPRDVVNREHLYRKHRLKSPVLNQSGKACCNMNEFWGGPFFDDDGNMIRSDLLCGGPKLADMVTTLSGKDKEVFLDFVDGMLQWLPEKRKTAKQLLEHSFFESFYKDRAQVL